VKGTGVISPPVACGMWEQIQFCFKIYSFERVSTSMSRGKGRRRESSSRLSAERGAQLRA